MRSIGEESWEFAPDNRRFKRRYFGKTKRKLPFPLSRYLKEALIFKRVLAAKGSNHPTLSNFYETSSEKILRLSDNRNNNNLIDDGGLLPFPYIAYSMNKRKRWLIPEMIRCMHTELADAIETERNSVSYFSINKVSYKFNCNEYCFLNGNSQYEMKNCVCKNSRLSIRPFYDFSAKAFVPKKQLENPTVFNYLFCYPLQKHRCHNYGSLTGSAGLKLCSNMGYFEQFMFTLQMNEKNMSRYERINHRLQCKRPKYYACSRKALLEEDFETEWYNSDASDESNCEYLRSNSSGTYDFYSMITKKFKKAKKPRRKRRKFCNLNYKKDNSRSENVNEYFMFNHIMQNRGEQASRERKPRYKQIRTIRLAKEEIESLRETNGRNFWTRNSERNLPYVILINTSVSIIPESILENNILFRINSTSSDPTVMKSIADVRVSLASADLWRKMLPFQLTSKSRRKKFVNIENTQNIDYYGMLYEFLRVKMDRPNPFHPAFVDGICEICLEEKSLTCLTTDCSHKFCMQCWKSHLDVRINSALRPVCIAAKCNSLITLGDLLTLYDMDIILPLIYKLTDDYLLRDFSCVRCKSCLCLQKMTADSLFFQCSCGVTQCRRCSCESHFPLSCGLYKQYFKYLFSKGYTDQFGSSTLYLIKGKRCPSCRRILNKNGGCNHISCTCGYEFCWQCLGKWNNSHYGCSLDNDDEGENITLIRKQKFLNTALYFRHKRLNSDDIKVALRDLLACSKNSGQAHLNLQFSGLLQEIFSLAEFLSAASNFINDSTQKACFFATVKKLAFIANHILYLCNIAILNNNEHNVQTLCTAADNAVSYIQSLCKHFKKLI